MIDCLTWVCLNKTEHLASMPRYILTKKDLVNTGSCYSMYLDEVLMDLMDLDLSEAKELQSLFIQYQNIEVIENSTMDA